MLLKIIEIQLSQSSKEITIDNKIKKILIQVRIKHTMTIILVQYYYFLRSSYTPPAYGYLWLRPCSSLP